MGPHNDFWEIETVQEEIGCPQNKTKKKKNKLIAL